ncbi:hypothetical protein LINPERHAP1_LOCUS38498 [Linum perenne]
MFRRPRPPPSSFLFLIILLLRHLTTATSAASFSFPPYASYKTAASISHSLLTRVSNLRAARGDFAGANRAKAIAEKLNRGLELGPWGFVWSIGWDYARNYAWSGLNYRELLSAVSDLNELMSFLAGFSSARSEAEKAAWISRNYGGLAKAAKSALGRLLNTFNKKGALKEVVETVQKEVVEGGLLRDCVEVGSNDLRGLIGILKDCVSRVYSGHPEL